MQKELSTIHAVTQTEGLVVQAMIFEIMREYNLTLGTATALVEAIALYEQLASNAGSMPTPPPAAIKLGNWI